MSAELPDISIVYEDADILVVDKQPGMLAVPIPDSDVINMLDLVRRYCGSRGRQVKNVHRIDRYTSGLMVFPIYAVNRKNLFNRGNFLAQFYVVITHIKRGKMMYTEFKTFICELAEQLFRDSKLKCDSKSGQ